MPSHYKKKMPDRYKKTANQTRAYCCSHMMITFINLYSLLYFVLHIVLTCIRQESANERYCNTMKYLPLLNAMSQKDEKPYTAGLEDTTIHCVHIYQTGFNVIEFFFQVCSLSKLQVVLRMVSKITCFCYPGLVTLQSKSYQKLEGIAVEGSVPTYFGPTRITTQLIKSRVK